MPKKINRNFPKFIEDFLKYRRVSKIDKTSKNTIIALENDIYDFVKWLKDYSKQDISIELLQKLEYTDMLDYIDKMNKPSTIGRKISSVRALFNYLNDDTVKLIDNKVMHNIHKPKFKQKDRPYLFLDQANDLIEAVKVEGDFQEYVIIQLMLNTAMRVSEIAALNKEDIIRVTIDEDEMGEVFIHGAKGDKDRIVFIDNTLMNLIEEWLKVRPETTNKDKALFVCNYFVNKEPYRITTTVIRNMIKKYKEMVGIKYCTPHTLRHTCATLLLDEEVNLQTIQELLGHEDIKTTAIYAKTTKKQLAKLTGKIGYVK